MSDFPVKLNTIATDTNFFLKKIFKKNKNLHLLEPMKYGLFSGGKRFRSCVIVNTGKIFNINYNNLIAIGAAVECIHSYSLIHDDLPAMDDDDLRRGKLATHKKFNEYTAILTGNSLLTLAFEIMSGNNLKLPAKIKNELIKILCIYSGYIGLAGGQYLDLTLENKKISKNKIIEIQKNKTGKLFAFCCETSAIIKNYSLKKRKNLKEIGLDIGLLFQVADDLIDFAGNSKIVGKPTQTDKSKGKQTLVNLIGYHETIKFAENLEKKIINKIKKYGIKGNDLLQSVKFILNREF